MPSSMRRRCQHHAPASAAESCSTVRRMTSPTKTTTMMLCSREIPTRVTPRPPHVVSRHRGSAWAMVSVPPWPSQPIESIESINRASLTTAPHATSCTSTRCSLLYRILGSTNTKTLRLPSREQPIDRSISLDRSKEHRERATERKMNKENRPKIPVSPSVLYLWFCSCSSRALVVDLFLFCSRSRCRRRCCRERIVPHSLIYSRGAFVGGVECSKYSLSLCLVGGRTCVVANIERRRGVVVSLFLSTSQSRGKMVRVLGLLRDRLYSTTLDGRTRSCIDRLMACTCVRERRAKRRRSSSSRASPTSSTCGTQRLSRSRSRSLGFVCGGAFGWRESDMPCTNTYTISRPRPLLASIGPTRWPAST